ncbi:hypothetical protein DFQ27_008768 [Actinomortierella ambigua]|uniref:Phosphoglycerate mutase-like protein n=1 Tax=Actinomortierella ambigua TaxID=1343610 RepID=A0A9P6PRQ5_9FUNG|nr:hypothetical protein DFQ27_008768 [Actinomortierella ambigua]
MSPSMHRTSLFFVRHGQRIDHVDSSWALSSPTPQDPPLTALGQEQSQKTGAALASLLYAHRCQHHHIHHPHCHHQHRHQQQQQQKEEDSSNMTPPDSPEAEAGEHLLPLPSRPQHVAIITSPFLRCTQTAVELAKGIRSQTADCHVTVAVEPGIAEWLSFEYVPQPVPESIIVQRMQDFAMTRREHEQYYTIDWKYRPHTTSLPAWPEAWDNMQRRVEAAYRHVISTYLDSVTTTAMSDKDVVVVFVSHASPVNALLEACLQTPTLVPIGLNSISQCSWISEKDYQDQEQARYPLVALASPPLGSTITSTTTATTTTTARNTATVSPSLDVAPKASPALTLAGQDGRWQLELKASVAHLS